jgi:hypothetical protein
MYSRAGGRARPFPGVDHACRGFGLAGTFGMAVVCSFRPPPSGSTRAAAHPKHVYRAGAAPPERGGSGGQVCRPRAPGRRYLQDPIR